MLKKDIFPKSKQNRIFHFKQKDWLQFASLLKSGNNILDALSIMKHDTLQIKQVIESGEKIETIVLKGQKGKFYEHLAFFLPMTSLPEAIYSAYHMKTFEKESVSKLTKKCTYPIFIFILSSVSIYLFTNFIIPQLLNGFDLQEEQFLFQVLRGIHFFSMFLIGFFLICIFMALFIAKKKNIHQYFYHRFLFRFFFIKEYVSYYLSGYLKSLRNYGLSSQDAFHYMKNIQQNTFLSYLCNELNTQLNKGIDMQEALHRNLCLDQKFKLHYAIGVNNCTLDESLQSYIESVELKWNALISKISITIQIISYLFVGILMICVYQIMLLPLEMLNQL